MKKYRIILLILAVAVMSTLLDGCFKKGEEDPFISLRSRKARISNKWEIASFNGDYLVHLNTGENRLIDLVQSDKKITETTNYMKISQATQDSLNAGQDTIITWKGTIDEAFYEIKKDGSFQFVYEYTLEKTHSKSYMENGFNSPITHLWPAFPGQNFKVDSTMSRKYKTVYTGRWNFLNNIDGYKKKERIIFEIEAADYTTELVTTYIFDAEDDDGVFPLNPVDTTFSFGSVEKINNQYANGERNILWEIEKLKNKEVTLVRELDQIYSHIFPNMEGYTRAKKGSETVELVPLEK